MSGFREHCSADDSLLQEVVNEDIRQFCQDHPEINFTANDLAAALHQAAAKMKVKESDKVAELVPEDAAAECNDNDGSPQLRKRSCQGVSFTFPVFDDALPPGSLVQPTSAKRARLGDVSAHAGSGSDFLIQSPAVEVWGSLPHHLDAAHDAAVPGFHSNANMSSRRDPPAPLNLNIPGAVPAVSATPSFQPNYNLDDLNVPMPQSFQPALPEQQQLDPTPTHYLVIPSGQGTTDMTNQQRIELASKALNNQHMQTPPPWAQMQPPVLMRSPLAILPSNYQGVGEIREIPPEHRIQDPNQLASAMKKFTFATPTTARTVGPTFINQRGHPDLPPYRGEWTCAQHIQGALRHGDGNLFRRKRFNLFAALAFNPNLLIQIGHHLHPKDLLNLYSVSSPFHYCIKKYILSSIGSWSQIWAADAFALIPWHCDSDHPFWRPGLSENDPSERTRDMFPRFQNPKKSASAWRLVPTMKYYQFIASRQETASEILATLARSGLRVPRATLPSLLKTWQLMEIPTNAERKAMIAKRRLFRDHDLVNLQIFIVKLLVRFNDPFYEGANPLLAQLFLGQKGWYPLWQMLFGHKYRTTLELIQLKLRYDHSENNPGFMVSATGEVRSTRGNDSTSIFGVPPNELCTGSKEHWGQDPQHQDRLWRVDELIAWEATRRKLELDKHLIHFLLWGHVDLSTGRNLAPTEKEIYIYDAKFKNRSVDTSHEFGMMECMKDKWGSLSQEERERVLMAQTLNEDRVKALGELASLSNPAQSKAALADAMTRFQQAQRAVRDNYGSKVAELMEEKLPAGGLDEYSDSDDEHYDISEAELFNTDDVDLAWSPEDLEDVLAGPNNTFANAPHIPSEEFDWDDSFLRLLNEIWWVFPEPPHWSELSQNAWAGFRRRDDGEDDDDDEEQQQHEDEEEEKEENSTEDDGQQNGLDSGDENL